MPPASFRLTIKPSKIAGAGYGLLLEGDGSSSASDEGSSKTVIPAGTRVAWYRGELLTAADYFLLDTAASPRLEYAHAIPDTDLGVAPRTDVLAADPDPVAVSQASAGVACVSAEGPSDADGRTTSGADGDDDPATSSSSSSSSRSSTMLGHFANDFWSLPLPPEEDDDEDGDDDGGVGSSATAAARECDGDPLRAYVARFEQALAAYGVVNDPPSAAEFAEVTIDFSWGRAGDSLAAIAEQQQPRGAPRVDVAFPMVLRGDVTLTPGRGSVELVLRYGASYWASRAISPLFWKNRQDSDRPLARRLYAVATRALQGASNDAGAKKNGASADAVKQQGGCCALTPLPPRPALRPVCDEDAAAVTTKSGLVVTDAESGNALSLEEKRLVGLAMFGRDPAVYRLPEAALTELIARAALASVSTATDTGT